MNKISLTFQEPSLEVKYNEDEQQKINLIIKQLLYLSVLISIALSIIAVVNNEYTLYLGNGLTLISLFLITNQAIKTYPLKCNYILMLLNFCLCLQVVLLVLEQVDNIENEFRKSSFLLGGAIYSLHIALLCGTNYLMNILVFSLINIIYVFVIYPTLPEILAYLIIPTCIIIFFNYQKSHNCRQYYQLVDKYFLWAYLSNNIIPIKLIITKYNQDKNIIELITINKQAKKQFQIQNSEDIKTWAQLIDIELENNINFQSGGGEPEDRIGVESIQSKSKLSQIQQQKSVFSKKSQLPPISLDLFLQNEISKQITLNQNKINEGELNSQNFKDNNASINLYDNTLNGQIVGGGQVGVGGPSGACLGGAGNIQFTTPLKKSPQNILRRNQKVDKYKAVYRAEGGEYNKEQKHLTLKIVSFQLKHELYQMIAIEDDESVQREILLEEMIQCKHKLSCLFATQCKNQVQALMQNIHQKVSNPVKRQNQTPSPQLQVLDLNSISLLLNDLVSSYFDYCLLEEGKMELMAKTISIKNLINEVVHELRNLIEKKSVRVSISNELQDIDIIINDEKKIKQILTHLLLNSLQHSVSGGFINIQLMIGSGDASGNNLNNSIKIMIRDNSQQAWPKQRKQFYFNTMNLLKAQYNSKLELEDVQMAVCKEIVKRVGPLDNIFIKCEESTHNNRVSFYLYTDINQHLVEILNNNTNNININVAQNLIDSGVFIKQASNSQAQLGNNQKSLKEESDYINQERFSVSLDEQVESEKPIDFKTLKNLYLPVPKLMKEMSASNNEQQLYPVIKNTINISY